jgi:CRISPR-associated protein Csd2
MNARKLIIFKHTGPLGNAPAQDLFRLVQVKRKDEVKLPRSFDDYIIAVEDKVPDGVELVSHYK